jgi:acetoacetate decarboxylase
MKEAEVRERAFAMPLTSPAYPPGPYRFIDREFLSSPIAPIRQNFATLGLGKVMHDYLR